MRGVRWKRWTTAVMAAALVLLAGCTSVGKADRAAGGGHGAVPTGAVTTDGAGAPSILRPDAKGEIRLVARPARLEIAPGVEKEVWTYNGRVPGPEIHVQQGQTIRVRFKNELPVPTTIHWHGYPVPNAMDGVPGVTQSLVRPGQEFVYEFKATVAGTYMYHAHQESADQVDRGLYGALVVEESKSAYDRDYTLILDEWTKAGDDAQQDGGGMDHGSMGGMTSESAGGETGQGMQGVQGMQGMQAMHGMHDMQGMQGMHGMSGDGTSPSGGTQHGMSMDMSMNMHPMRYDVFTINGQSGSLVEPLTVKEGERVRIRLINMGYLRHDLHLHGHSFTVVARDGQPVAGPQPLRDQLISIAPGERVDIAFTANNPGTWYLEAHDQGAAAAEGMRVAIRYEGASQQTDRPNATAKLPVADLLNYGKDERGPFTLDEGYDVTYTMELGTAMGDTGVIYTINGKTFPDTPPIRVKKGDVVQVRIVNRSPADEHPMHLHGHFFQVLSRNGRPLKGAPVIKDTLNVKPGEEYVIAFRADNPGTWVFHCHELHHAAGGMVTQVLYAGYVNGVQPEPDARPE